jgi:hypothetical protein
VRRRSRAARAFLLFPLPSSFSTLLSFLLATLVTSVEVGGRDGKKTGEEGGKENKDPEPKLTPSLPMTWQATAAFLACARIGAVHSAVFAGFSAESLRDRVKDCDCKVVITTE